MTSRTGTAEDTLDQFRIWTKVVFGSMLFLISVFQSVQYVTKYASSPTSVTVGEEELQREDSPWITVCPDPPLNIMKNEQFLTEMRNNFSSPTAFPAQLMTITLDSLPALAARNISWEDYFDRVGKPLWLHSFSCKAKFQTSAGGSTSCQFSQSLKTKPAGMNSDEPIIHSTPGGPWETRFYLDVDFSTLRLCSTLKSEIAFKKGINNAYAFTNSLYRGPDYNISSSGFKVVAGRVGGKYSRLYLPRVRVYVHGPEMKEILDGFDELRPVILNYGGDINWVSVTSIEKVVRQSVPSKRCVDLKEDPSYEMASCRMKVFESFFPCRLPLFRSAKSVHSPSASLPEPPPCRSAEDFSKFNKALKKAVLSGFTDTIDEAARKACPDLCTQLRLSTEVTSIPNLVEEYSRQQPRPPPGAAAGLEDHANEVAQFLLADGHFVLWRVHLTSSYVYTTTQYFSYEFGQFLGELGGAWGLFLGASVVTLFNIVDGILSRMLGAGGTFPTS